jgi:hypothetical protein
MPEEIKEIVRKLLREASARGHHGSRLSWEGVAAWNPEDFDTLFEWLKDEAEKE